MKEIILGIIRHALTYGGGVLTSKGLMDGTEIEVAVSAAITLGGLIWSIYSKIQASRAN